MSAVSISLTNPLPNGQDASAGTMALSPAPNPVQAATADRMGNAGSSFLSQLAEACHQSNAVGAQPSFYQSSSEFVSGNPLSSASTRTSAASGLNAAPPPLSKVTGNEISISQIAPGMSTMPPLSAQSGDLPGRQPDVVATGDLQGPDNPQVGAAGVAVEPMSNAQSATRRPPLATAAKVERQSSTRASTNPNGPSSDAVRLVPLSPADLSPNALQVSASPVPFSGTSVEAARSAGGPGQKSGSFAGDPVGGLASAEATVARGPRGDWNEAAAPIVAEDHVVASAASGGNGDYPTAAGSAPVIPAIAPAGATASSHSGGHAHLGSPPDDQAAASPSVAAPTPSAAFPALASETAAGGVLFTASAGQDVAAALPGPSLQTSDLFAAPSATPLDASGAPAQVGESLLTLASLADGASQISVSMHPKELGAVRVQLDRAPDGTVRVLVAASEPGTLRSLMANQEHLHAALDAAAVPTNGRHVSFELVPVTSATASDASAPAGTGHPDAAGGASALSAQPNSSMMGFDGFNQRGQGTPSNTTSRSGLNGADGLNGEDAGQTLQANAVLALHLLPSGSINITA